MRVKQKSQIKELNCMYNHRKQLLRRSRLEDHKPLNRYSLESRAFTLSEVIITVGIIGILSSIALPNYFRQIQRTHQAETNATMSQMMATVAAFTDEFGTQPTRWVDLNAITTLMTNKGPAVINDGELTTAITLPGERYELIRIDDTNTDKYYTFQAIATNKAASDFNVIACINLKTGTSDQIIGRKDEAADIDSLTCQRSK
jgi:prepilin-type N-terminal cleavage/methylation domain-containing protein